MTNIRQVGLIGILLVSPWILGASKDGGAPAKAPLAATSNQTPAASAEKAGSGTVASRTPGRPVYRPPLRGAPAGRIGGGTRGTSERESFSLQVLAPDHVGFTMSDQPSLYWFISKPTTHPIELTVTETNAVKPVLEKVIRVPEHSGIQAIRLADFGVRLRPKVSYKWFVTLVTDADHRSKDILAGGIVESIEPGPALTAKLKGADRGEIPYAYAEEGFWYDALEALSSMIERSPADAGLRRQRAELLEQVGLLEAAEFERRELSKQ